MAFAHQVNAGINKELLESIQIPSQDSTEVYSSPLLYYVIFTIHDRFHYRLQVVFYNKLLVEKMIKLASSGCAYDSRVRLVTLEILIASLHMIVIR